MALLYPILSFLTIRTAGNARYALPKDDRKRGWPLPAPAPLPAVYATWYVDENGDSLAGGTRAAPFATVDRALTALREAWAGDWPAKGTASAPADRILINGTVTAGDNYGHGACVYADSKNGMTPRAPGTISTAGRRPPESNGPARMPDLIIGGLRERKTVSPLPAAPVSGNVTADGADCSGRREP
jgi:hypothetical protein